jgi:hypothetical protein
MPVPPGSIHLHKHSPSVLHLPLWVSATGQIRNSQSSVAGVGLSLGENHFPTDSLTWRELLTGLTTCLFYHNPDNPERECSTSSAHSSTQLQPGEDNNNGSTLIHTGMTVATKIGYGHPKMTTIHTKTQHDSVRNNRRQQATLSRGTAWPQQPTIMTHT